jgi:hypothetical protein
MQKLAFKDIKEEIRKINPEFVEIVESVKGAQNCGVYLAEYRYGDYIVKAGGFNVPIAGELKDLRECDDKLKTDLGYNFMTNPISMSLDKTIELYIQLDDSSTPFKLYEAGSLFGFTFITSLSNKDSRTPSGITSWDLTAGLRNIVSLSSLSDKNGLNALMRHFDYVCSKPDSLFDHWQVIRGIGRNDPQWRCRMLYFNVEWFDKLSSKAWMPIKLYFYDQFNLVMQFYSNYLPWNMSFSLAQKKRNILVSSSVNETVKYLFGVATGFLAGHSVASGEVGLPLNYIQKNLLQVYGLSEYVPIIMAPQLLKNSPVCYSLQYPMQPASIKLDPSRSIIQRHDELYHTLNRYINDFRTPSEYHVKNTPLMEAAKNVHFDFYHRNAQRYEYMFDSATLINYEEFKQAVGQYKGKFPNTASYFNGAVRIWR